MRYLKTYESIIDGPQIGDYVICDEGYDEWSMTPYGKKLANFINNNIGNVVKIRKGTKFNQKNKYTIQYQNIPIELEQAFNTWGNKNIKDYKIRYFSIKEIKYYSKNKEDCEAYLASKKYNL